MATNEPVHVLTLKLKPTTQICFGPGWHEAIEYDVAMSFADMRPPSERAWRPV